MAAEEIDLCGEDSDIADALDAQEDLRLYMSSSSDSSEEDSVGIVERDVKPRLVTKHVPMQPNYRCGAVVHITWTAVPSPPNQGGHQRVEIALERLRDGASVVVPAHKLLEQHVAHWRRRRRYHGPLAGAGGGDDGGGSDEGVGATEAHAGRTGPSWGNPIVDALYRAIKVRRGWLKPDPVRPGRWRSSHECEPPTESRVSGRRPFALPANVWDDVDDPDQLRYATTNGIRHVEGRWVPGARLDARPSWLHTRHTPSVLIQNGITWTERFQQAPISPAKATQSPPTVAEPTSSPVACMPVIQAVDDNSTVDAKSKKKKKKKKKRKKKKRKKSREPKVLGSPGTTGSLEHSTSPMCDVQPNVVPATSADVTPYHVASAVSEAPNASPGRSPSKASHASPSSVASEVSHVTPSHVVAAASGSPASLLLPKFGTQRMLNAWSDVSPGPKMYADLDGKCMSKKQLQSCSQSDLLAYFTPFQQKMLDCLDHTSTRGVEAAWRRFVVALITLPEHIAFQRDPVTQLYSHWRLTKLTQSLLGASVRSDFRKLSLVGSRSRVYPSGTVRVAEFDYAPKQKDELALVKGQKYTFCFDDVLSSGWCVLRCRRTGTTGLAPKNHTSVDRYLWDPEGVTFVKINYDKVMEPAVVHAEPAVIHLNSDSEDDNIEGPSSSKALPGDAVFTSVPKPSSMTSNSQGNPGQIPHPASGTSPSSTLQTPPNATGGSRPRHRDTLASYPATTASPQRQTSPAIPVTASHSTPVTSSHSTPVTSSHSTPVTSSLSPGHVISPATASLSNGRQGSLGPPLLHGQRSSEGGPRDSVPSSQQRSSSVSFAPSPVGPGVGKRVVRGGFVPHIHPVDANRKRSRDGSRLQPSPMHQ